MQDLDSLLTQLREHRPAAWDQLPDFALYMDQVLNYMDRQVIRFDEADGLTAAMVNNYTKSGLVPRAKGKKYDRDHLAYLTVICVLKHVMTTKDMDFLIREELHSERGIPTVTPLSATVWTALWAPWPKKWPPAEKPACLWRTPPSDLPF